MALTFIDSGVLIAAARGVGELGWRAFAVLDDPSRTFASSQFVRLEVVPKALFQRQRDEVDLYRAFFAGVSQWAEPLDAVIRRAYTEAVKHGLSAIDGLHVAAAIIAGANELVTAERSASRLCRVTSIPIRTIRG